jgi:hypothetical protein
MHLQWPVLYPEHFLAELSVRHVPKVRYFPISQLLYAPNFAIELVIH